MKQESKSWHTSWKPVSFVALCWRGPLLLYSIRSMSLGPSHSWGSMNIRIPSQSASHIGNGIVSGKQPDSRRRCQLLCNMTWTDSKRWPFPCMAERWQKVPAHRLVVYTCQKMGISEETCIIWWSDPCPFLLHQACKSLGTLRWLGDWGGDLPRWAHVNTGTHLRILTIMPG